MSLDDIVRHGAPGPYEWPAVPLADVAHDRDPKHIERMVAIRGYCGLGSYGVFRCATCGDLFVTDYASAAHGRKYCSARCKNPRGQRPTTCAWCGGPLNPDARADARYCGATCRKRAQRSRR